MAPASPSRRGRYRTTGASASAHDGFVPQQHIGMPGSTSPINRGSTTTSAGFHPSKASFLTQTMTASSLSPKAPRAASVGEFELHAGAAGLAATGRCERRAAGRTQAKAKEEQGLYWGEGPPEEERLFDETDPELFPRGDRWPPQQTQAPKEALERMGDMMALLGPRYKTLPPGMIWEKAVEGGTTPLQRQLKRLGVHAPKRGPLCPMTKRDPEDQPDIDIEAESRTAWLAHRRREKERRGRNPMPP